MIDTFKDPQLVKHLAEQIVLVSKNMELITIMHVCGTHEHEISRYALRQLLPPQIDLIAGPGCPVCITPASMIVAANKLAMMDSKHLLVTYGDVMRIPVPGGSLSDTRSQGADIRIVYSMLDAIKLAHENPDREVIFFSVGFETTAAPVASLLLGVLPNNFSIYPCHRYVPTALQALVKEDPIMRINGFLLPGHAAIITGGKVYEFLPHEYGRASAIAGFEPSDILNGIWSIVKQIKEQKTMVDNCYKRAVRFTGNPKAQYYLNQVFKKDIAAWRGIGDLPDTGFELKSNFDHINAKKRFQIKEDNVEDVMPGCSCPQIMLGHLKPSSCPLFSISCTPITPKGPCMVSQEGTCRAHYVFKEI
ncbi:MAG: hydrogenase formation protein HypD [Desulfobacterales bacterium]|nr:hydrogenase formation protein HypD [Desulfobacterales bacterium]